MPEVAVVGKARKRCYVCTLVAVVTTAVALCSCVFVFSKYFIGYDSFARGAAMGSPPPSQPFQRDADGGSSNSDETRIQVVQGNGCFWERQYAYALLEHESNKSFGHRGVHNLTSRVGYAGSTKVGDDGLVC